MADVVVAGSINMDIVASTQRHPLPGETISGTDLAYFPGGKGANQAVASARAGANVRMVGAVGSDAFGPELLAFLRSSGVDVTDIETREGPTGTALIVVAADGENTIVVVPGANGTVDEATATRPKLTKGDVLVSQHEIPQDSVAAFFKAGQKVGATCILNPAPARPTPVELLALVDVLILNETELALLSGVEIDGGSSRAEIVSAIESLGLTGAVVATLGSRGALAVVGDRQIDVEGYEVTAVDTTGAGDCFVGSFAAQLTTGSTIDEALEYANAAAALCVTKPGAGPSMPTHTDVTSFQR